MSRDRKYSRYCGQLKEFEIESDKRTFRVTFRSNDRLDGTGFHGTYHFLPESDPNPRKPLGSSADSTIITSSAGESFSLFSLPCEDFLQSCCCFECARAF
jgi:hypothetical protein